MRWNLSFNRASFHVAASFVPSQLTHVCGSASLPVRRSQVSRLPTICDIANLKRSKSSISLRLL